METGVVYETVSAELLGYGIATIAENPPGSNGGLIQGFAGMQLVVYWNQADGISGKGWGPVGSYQGSRDATNAKIQQIASTTPLDLVADTYTKAGCSDLIPIA